MNKVIRFIRSILKIDPFWGRLDHGGNRFPTDLSRYRKMEARGNGRKKR